VQSALIPGVGATTSGTMLTMAPVASAARPPLTASIKRRVDGYRRSWTRLRLRPLTAIGRCLGFRYFLEYDAVAAGAADTSRVTGSYEPLQMTCKRSQFSLLFTHLVQMGLRDIPPFAAIRARADR